MSIENFRCGTINYLFNTHVAIKDLKRANKTKFIYKSRLEMAINCVEDALSISTVVKLFKNNIEEVIAKK